MAENRSFVFYKSWLEASKHMNDEEKLKFYEALASYGLEGELPENMPPTVAIAMSLITSSMDTNRERREKTINARKEAGKRHKGNQYTRKKDVLEQTEQTDENQTALEQNGTNAEQNGTYNVNVNVNVSSESNDSQMLDIKENPSREGVKEKPQLFTPPTLEEVLSFAVSMAESDEQKDVLTIEGKKFFNNYESSGWLLANGNMMKNWKASYRSWIDKADKFGTKKPKPKRYAETQAYDLIDATERKTVDGHASMNEYISNLRLAFDGDKGMREKYPNWQYLCRVRGIAGSHKTASV